MRIRFVIDTHLHADHRLRRPALAEAAGADYVLARRAPKSRFRSGRARRRACSRSAMSLSKVLHTPGHTPEHICLLVTDRTRADEPWFVLTGHTLMVGDVGRTELADDAEAGARDLFRSLQTAEGAARLPRGSARRLCGLGLRPAAERQALLDHRLREAAQRGVPDRRAKPSSSRFMLADIPPRPAGGGRDCAPRTPA